MGEASAHRLGAGLCGADCCPLLHCQPPASGRFGLLLDQERALLINLLCLKHGAVPSLGPGHLCFTLDEYSANIAVWVRGSRQDSAVPRLRAAVLLLLRLHGTCASRRRLHHRACAALPLKPAPHGTRFFVSCSRAKPDVDRRLFVAAHAFRCALLARLRPAARGTRARAHTRACTHVRRARSTTRCGMLRLAMSC